ncbi:MAG: hypothetical protein ACOYME_00955 [Prochlorotrichaceae cyanobacterium]
MRQEPIPFPSEPMQYRAIGLVQGKYVPSDDQLTQGVLLTPDGHEINAFVLGRVLSLVKKHVDLNESHLWVVYPRTQEVKSKKPIKRAEEAPTPTPPQLRVQIVGIWEPETLHCSRDEETVDNDAVLDIAAEVENPSIAAAIALAPKPSIPVNSGDEAEKSVVEDGYFSIRGEIIYYTTEKAQVIVKIQQLNRKEPGQQHTFKLHLFGTLTQERILHYFWDLQVQRQGDRLVIVKANCIGAMPPKRRSLSGDSRSRMDRRDRPTGDRPLGNRPERSSSLPPAASSSPPRTKPILAKPQKDLSKS